MNENKIETWPSLTYTRAIAATFKDQMAQEHLTIERNAQDGPTSTQIVQDWFDKDNIDYNLPTDIFVGVSDLVENIVDDPGPEPELPRYEDIVVDNPAYTWLLSRLKRVLLLTSPTPNSMQNISTTVLNTLSEELAFRMISSTRDPHLCFVRYYVDWDLYSFIADQEYLRVEKCPWECYHAYWDGH